MFDPGNPQTKLLYHATWQHIGSMGLYQPSMQPLPGCQSKMLPFFSKMAKKCCQIPNPKCCQIPLRRGNWFEKIQKSLIQDRTVDTMHIKNFIIETQLESTLKSRELIGHLGRVLGPLRMEESRIWKSLIQDGEPNSCWKFEHSSSLKNGSPIKTLISEILTRGLLHYACVCLLNL